MARRILSRHSIKPKGEDRESSIYKGISESGVELARESAKEMVRYVEESPEGSVIFLAGVSDAPRTRSTEKVYSEELRNALGNKGDYIFVTANGLSSDGKAGYTAMGNRLAQIIKENPNKKVIVDTPMYVKEFSLNNTGWFEKDGKTLTSFAKKLLERNGNDERKAVEDWLSNGNEIDGEIGPDPVKAAQRYEKGVARLEEFAKRYVGNRPYTTGVVGHSFDSDAYLTYLAGEGKINKETFGQLAAGKGMIRESEMAHIDVGSDFTTVEYRGRQHKKKTLEHITAGFLIGSLILLLLPFLGMTGNVTGNSGNQSILGTLFMLIAIVSAIILFVIKKIL